MSNIPEAERRGQRVQDCCNLMTLGRLGIWGSGSRNFVPFPCLLDWTGLAGIREAREEFSGMLRDR
jgi:hypothetical protein